MSGTSNVGQASVYEGNEQKAQKDNKDNDNQPERFEEGKQDSHKADDPKDERSIANRLAAESKKSKEEKERDENGDTLETQLLKQDPTAVARAHGNEPSKGAKIDKAIEDEEAEIIAKMDEKKAQKAKN